MKDLTSIKENHRLIISFNSHDGIAGTIHMPGWTGTIICSWGGGWEHVSVAPSKKRITPSWDDMCLIKDIFFKEDEAVIQIHPPKSEYVNNMPNCLHLWRPIDQEMPLPPSIFVGIRNGQSLNSAKQEIAKFLGGK